MAAFRFPVGDVLDSSPVTLGDFYRENGESEHLVRLEAALPAGWMSTREVAIAADVSAQFARKGLEYLFEEGRAEKRRAQHGRTRRRSGRIRLEWRRPG